MDNPEMYRSTNQLQRNNSTRIIEEYLPISKKIWKDDDSVLDIGCGDGSVTVEILKPLLPTYKYFESCDVSQDMIEFAKKHYNDSGIIFTIKNVLSKPDPEDIERFNHIFSFHALHMIKDLRIALENIYQILKDGGDFTCIIFTKFFMFETLKKMCENPKWKAYLTYYEKFQSFIQNSLCPEQDFKTLMQSIGFKEVTVKLTEGIHYYENYATLKDHVVGVNIYAKYVPKELREEFEQDFMKTILSLSDLNKNKAIDDQVCLVYYSIDCYAVK